MNNIKSFEEIYQGIKDKNEVKFNEIFSKVKREAEKIKKLSLVICTIVDILIILLGWQFAGLNITGMRSEKITIMAMSTIVPIIIADVIIYFIVYACNSKNHREYAKMFKSYIIKDLINSFYTDLEYLPDNGLQNEVYDEGKYGSYYNRYYSDDYIKAKIDGKNDIEMSEVTVQRVERHTDSKGRSHTTTTTLFSGLFAKIKLDKSINTELKITRNMAVIGKNRLRMDSQEFEKYFDVSCQNKIVGMQILTADIMERLVEFCDKKIPYDISIYGEYMYIRFSCGEVFEIASVKEGAFPEEKLNEYYDILNFTYDVSSEIIKTVSQTEI